MNGLLFPERVPGLLNIIKGQSCIIAVDLHRHLVIIPTVKLDNQGPDLLVQGLKMKILNHPDNVMRITCIIAKLGIEAFIQRIIEAQCPDGRFTQDQCRRVRWILFLEPSSFYYLQFISLLEVPVGPEIIDGMSLIVCCPLWQVCVIPDQSARHRTGQAYLTNGWILQQLLTESINLIT